MAREKQEMADHVEATLAMADEIIKSVDDDADAALLKVVGTLAHVLFLIESSDREELLESSMEKLRNYLRLLDQMEAVGASVERRRH
ncbi:hypothetical protein [Bradyrhizobium roseum]|uniref:hypothetical protein n=1 Tax=Bradyrhizobium roseum TaxID=3056648 RepID=UPI00261A8768|nr:hypothetical protein [Bradyrhizobium roseus]WKA29339.1 hypothetical protein QUH67_03870 [Bradyrhizobium roseus]